MEYKTKCGCIVAESPPNFKIKYCPKHEAAPDLYEALRYLLDFLAMPTDEWIAKYGAGVTQKQACDKARKVLAKVESK